MQGSKTRLITYKNFFGFDRIRPVLPLTPIPPAGKVSWDFRAPIHLPIIQTIPCGLQ